MSQITNLNQFVTDAVTGAEGNSGYEGHEKYCRLVETNRNNQTY
jgi:hypothetical protein